MKVLRHIIVCGFMCGVFFQGNLAIAMNCIVVNSTVTNIPSGTKLVLQSNIDVPDDQQVKIVCEDASSTTIQGPYQGPLKVPAAEQPQKPTTMNIISKILSLLTSSDDTSTIGASRSALAPGESVGPWTILLQDGAQEFCLTPDRIPTLLRPESTWPTTLSIESLYSGDLVSTSMAQDEATLAWPNSLPIGDRTIFWITEDPGSRKATVRFVLLEESFSSPIELALAMAEHGCTHQSRLLIIQM